MKYVANIPGKRLKKETRSALVKIGKEVSSLSDTVMGLLSTSGFVYSDGQNTFEIKVSRNVTKAAAAEEEV